MNGNRIDIHRSAAIAWVLLLLFLGGVAGLVASRKLGWGRFGRSAGTPVFQVSNGAPLVNAGSLAEGFRPVVKRALPAVVNISTTTIVRTAPMFSDPFFRDFFEGFGQQFGTPQKRKVASLGSGVIVSADGYIATNNHVVQGASEIIVSTVDKKDLRARIVGSDPKTDIAVLKVSDNDLPFLTLGDSSSLDVGDIVLAMGNPFGIGQTVTMGIVSALGRGIGIETYEDFIQTDAAINPGNSGGALVNVRGELVGINTAILSRGGGSQGVGFAIPSNLARQVMNQLVKNGKVVRGYLGVTIQAVGTKEAKAFGLQQAQGALVGDVEPNSPAARAGLAKGDVIVGIDGKKVQDNRDAQFKIAAAAPGAKLKLQVVRDGSEKEIPVTLGELAGERQAGGVQNARGSALDGVDVEELTAEIARQLQLRRQTAGVVVNKVDPASPAADVGLNRGDVIQEVNRTPVTNVASFERALRQAGNKPVLLLVNRGGRTRYLVVDSK